MDNGTKRMMEIAEANKGKRVAELMHLLDDMMTITARRIW